MFGVSLQGESLESKMEIDGKHTSQPDSWQTKLQNVTMLSWLPSGYLT